MGNEEVKIKWKDIPLKEPWLRNYRAAKYRCQAKTSKYYARGIKFDMTPDDFKQLWFRDKAYEMKRASIDRIDKNKSYHLDNCQFMELSKNVCKDNTGSLNADAKLNEQKVMDIKRRYLAGGISQRELGEEYGVRQGIISGIMLGHYWKHVALPEIVEYVPEGK